MTVVKVYKNNKGVYEVLEITGVSPIVFIKKKLNKK